MAIISIISMLFCLGLGIFVFSRNPKRTVNIGFALGMASLAITEFGHFMAGIAQDPFRPFFWEKMSIAGEMFLPGTWLIFSLTFARANYAPILRRWFPLIILFSLSPVGSLIFMGSSDRFVIPSIDIPVKYFIVGRIGYASYIFLLAGLLINLMCLEQTLRASSGRERWQVKYMILGIGAVMAFKIYETGQILLFSSIRLDIIPIHSTALIIADSAILFALVRHRLLDVDIFVSRYVIYNSVTLIGVGVYLLSVGLMVFGVQRLGSTAYIPLIPLFVFVSLLAMFSFILSDQLRRKVKAFININFYKNRHDYRIKWQEFTGAVGTRLSMSELIPSFVAWLGDTIGTNEVTLWLSDQSSNLFSEQSLVTGKQHTIDRDSPFIKLLERHGGPIVVEDVKGDREWDEAFEGSSKVLGFLHASVYVPIYLDKEIIGFIALGSKITGDPYDYHDLELLKTVADQVAGQIHRIRMGEELAMARQMEAFHMLSSFLLHDLKNFTSSLSLLVQNAVAHQDNPEFRRDAFKTLQKTVTKMNQLIRRVAEFSNRLDLSKSEVNINQLIEEAIINLNGMGKRKILRDLGEMPAIYLDPGQISKVLQNILQNAYEATHEEGIITIRSWGDKLFSYIEVLDNGQGISQEFIRERLFKPFQTTKGAGFGIGLFQCKKIIDAHGGRIEVESIEGKGSRFRVVMPVE